MTRTIMYRWSRRAMFAVAAAWLIAQAPPLVNLYFGIGVILLAILVELAELNDHLNPGS